MRELMFRRLRLSIFFVSSITAIVASTFMDPMVAYAESFVSSPVYTVTVNGTAVDGVFDVLNGNGGSNYWDMPSLNIPTAATVTGVTLQVHWKGQHQFAFHVQNLAHADQDSPTTPCSITAASSTVVNTSSCTWASGSNGWSFISNVTNLNSNLAWRAVRFSGSNRIASVDAISVIVHYTLPSTFTVTKNTADPILPGQSVSYTIDWDYVFEFPDQPKYGYFFPYGKSDDNYCDAAPNFDDCNAEVVKLFELQRMPLGGSGSYTFTYAYPRPGSFSGTVIFSSDCPWHAAGTGVERGDLQSDIDNSCYQRHADVVTSISSVELLDPSEVTTSGRSWTNGGGSTTGSYLASDKRQYEIGEPVYLHWYFNTSGVPVNKVELYSGSGTELLATYTASGMILEDTSYYARIYYSTAGVYHPSIRLCFDSGCSSFPYRFYLGGISSPDPANGIQIVNTIYGGQGGSGVSSQFCSNTGLFGLEPSSFALQFAGTGSNSIVQGLEDVSNKGIGAIFWLSANMFCYVQTAPIISDIRSIIAPAPGTYTFPDEWFCVPGFGCAIEENPFPYDSFVIEYNETPAAHTFWSAALPLFVGVELLYIVINGIFGKSRHHS